MALLKRKNNNVNPSAPKKQTITVNPYENPENVMELMAKICAATSSVDTDVYWDEIKKALSETEGKEISLRKYIDDNRGRLFNYDFYHDLDKYTQQLSWNLQGRDNTEHAKVVVAGGFSSGKSSFLNKLTKSQNLLPTGVEPVSVVKTYLYCSKNKRNVTVKGVNHKNVLVTLDNGVLQAIQHTNESNVCLASVLDKLFVEIPSTELDGVVFIDTPGYNNSDKANKSNGKTDKETTIDALKEGKGNVLFWLTDCERPVITTADLEMIKEFEGKKVFIFNKADKKGEKECKKIIDSEAQKLYNEFPKEEIIDVIAFSTLENKVYYSKNNNSFNKIINDVKKCGNGISEQNNIKNDIEDLFNLEIEASNDTIENIKKEYEKAVEDKSEIGKEYHDIQHNDDDYITSEVRKMLVNSYNEVMNAADKIKDASKYALDSFYEFLMGVWNFENNDHWGSSSILDAALNQANKTYDRAVTRHDNAIKYTSQLWQKKQIRAVTRHNNAIKYTYYNNEDYRKDLAKRVQDYIADRFKESYDSACEKCDELLHRKEKGEQIIKEMKDYKRIFMSALEQGIRNYNKNNNATDIQVEKENVPNVFECIQRNDYKAFLHSFENGVDMAVCNSDGYSPMTLAVQKGNDMMVKFMLDHEADPTIKDRRGYNAFHTAVENQYRDICKMLLDVAPDLIQTKTDKGETVEELANRQTFTKWIENEINNAF